MKKNLFSLLLVATVFVANAQIRLFVDPEFSKIGNNHQFIAIVPFKTTVSLRPKQMEKLKDGDLQKMEEDESSSIQLAMYSWFLKRKQQGSLWVDVQDVNTTNTCLARNGVNYTNLSDFTPEEIADMLDVDAVIKGNFETNKPMSEEASLALGVLFGFYGATNQATINMFIHNGEDGKVLVNYHKSVAGSIGSTSDQLINIIMRKTSRMIPYTKPKE